MDIRLASMDRQGSCAATGSVWLTDLWNLIPRNLGQNAHLVRHLPFSCAHFFFFFFSFGNLVREARARESSHAWKEKAYTMEEKPTHGKESQYTWGK